MKYQPVIGMEVHVQLKTKSKMFCGCQNGLGLEKESNVAVLESEALRSECPASAMKPNVAVSKAEGLRYEQGAKPNVHICPVCTAQPGSLPVINGEAVKMVIKTGLALDCKIAEDSFFERKNYFYPDLPKGYQISQYQKPLCYEGYLEILVNNRHAELVSASRNETPKPSDISSMGGSASGGEALAGRQVWNDGTGENLRKIRIRRIHLEEDTGKLIHPKGANYSLVDFNRAGAPLMELVTEPDVKLGEEAKKFCQELQLILRYLGVSDADMEKGQMRCEVNISLRQPTTNNQRPTELGTKVEIKNLNSFRVVEKAIDYEIKRQGELLGRGEKIIQETRGWDDSKGETYSQRIKEGARDYRYFPEPDLPPLRRLSTYSYQLKTEIPEFPRQKRERLASEYGLPKNDVEVFVQNKDLSEYFEEVCSELTRTEHLSFRHSDGDSPKDLINNDEILRGVYLEEYRRARDDKKNEELKKLYKLAANYLITEIPRAADKLEVCNYDLKDRINPENFAEFAVIVFKEIVSSSGAQILLEEMFKTGIDPTHVIETKNLKQVGDVVTLGTIVDEVIEKNPQPVEDYKKGKEASLQFLVGQVMKKTEGKANPHVVAEILKKRLTK